MRDGGVQERAERLTARVDALAAALHDCGAAEDATTRLLGLASSAVLQALTLELLRTPAPATPSREEPTRDPSLPLAA